MHDRQLIDTLVQVSCSLSILGSLIVAFTWAYPMSNRKKPGRILLLWLSVADFLSSVFYLAQTFKFVRENDAWCKATALLDIFFPVASFLWTDFIALYLFLVVRARLSSSQLHWKKILFRFHAVVWSISTLILLLVLLTHHAGKDDGHQSDDNDDDFASNTGGWCWVTGDTRRETFIWELIGGKLVEWISALMITYLYISVACTVLAVDRSSSSPERPTTRYSPIPAVSSATPSSRPSNPKAIGQPAPTAYENDRMYDSDFSGRQGSLGKSIEASDLDLSSPSSLSDSIHTPRAGTAAPGHYSHGPRPPRRSRSDYYHPPHNPAQKFFSRFYMKLACLPFFFIVMRVWSTVRVLLHYLGHDRAADHPTLVILNAVCDPAQGFVNGVLFVLSSPPDRKRLWHFLHYHASRVWRKVFSCGEDDAPSPSRRGWRLMGSPLLPSSSPSSFPPNAAEREGGEETEGAGGGGRRGGRGDSQPPLRERSAAPPSLVSSGNDKAYFSHRLLDPQLDGLGLGTVAPPSSLDEPTDADEDEDSEEEIFIEDDFECGDDERMSDFSFDANSYFDR